MFLELDNVFPADGRARKEIWIYGSISRERMNECKWGGGRWSGEADEDPEEGGLGYS